MSRMLLPLFLAVAVFSSGCATHTLPVWRSEVEQWKMHNLPPPPVGYGYVPKERQDGTVTYVLVPVGRHGYSRTPRFDIRIRAR